MRSFILSLQALWLLGSSQAFCLDFNNNFYAAYQAAGSGGTTVLYVVPKPSVVVVAADPPMPVEVTPSMPGMTITLTADGLVSQFTTNQLTAADMPGLGAQPAAYHVSAGHFDGDGKRDLLLKGEGPKGFVIGAADANGDTYIVPRTGLNRAQHGLRPSDVFVVYDSASPYHADPAALAQAYRTARNIPAANVLGVDFTMLTGIGRTARSATRAQVTPLVNAVANGIAASGHPIKAVVFIGDFPGWLSDVHFHSGSNSYAVGFFDAFMDPAYFLQLPVGGSFMHSQTSDKFWGHTAANYPGDISPWRFNRPDPTGIPAVFRKINPWFNPVAMPSGGYAVFNMPLSIMPDPTQYWLRAIAAEAAHYADFGSAVFYPGSAGNAVSRHFIEEAKYEGHSLADFHWAGFAGGLEKGGPLFPDPLPDQDPQGYTRMPGDSAFSAGALSDLFFISPGVRSYYDAQHGPELPGDYQYRVGAIALFSQSFGAAPPTTHYLRADRRPAIAAALTDVPINTETRAVSVSFVSDLGGPGIALLQVKYAGPSPELATVSATTAGIVEGKVDGVAGFSVGLTQSQAAELRSVTQYANASAAAQSGGLWSVHYLEGSGISRAAAAIAAGATIAMGVTREPLANGDPSTVGLFTTLWYGGSVGEWSLRMKAGYAAENTLASEIPRAVIIYGDPLYAPFRWRARPVVLTP